MERTQSNTSQQVTMKTLVAIASTTVLSAMTCAAQAAEFTCHAKSHTVIIETSANDRFEYRSWGNKKSLSDAPDLVLRNGSLQIDGTGACRARTWTFRSGGYEYAVLDSAACSEKMPPKDAVGRLTVSLKGETKADWWCQSAAGRAMAQTGDAGPSKDQDYPAGLLGTWQGDDNASMAIYGKVRIGKGVISWGGPHNPQCKTTYKVPASMPAISKSFPDRPSHTPDRSGYFVYRLEVDTTKCTGADRILQLAVDARTGKEADVVTYGSDGKPSGFHSFSKTGN